MKFKFVFCGMVFGLCSAFVQAQPLEVRDLSLQDPTILRTAEDMFNQLYGDKTYWEKHGCWVTAYRDAEMAADEDDYLFCMKPLAIHAVLQNDAPVQFYIQATGLATNPQYVLNEDSSLNDDNDFITGHSVSGAFGAFIVDVKSMEYIAGNAATIYPLGWGNGPDSPLTLIQISEKGDFAWLGEGGFVYQGIGVTIPVLYAQHGEEIENIIGNIPGVTEETQDYVYEYALDPTQSNDGYYAIQITQQGSGSTHTFEAKYNSKLGHYQCDDALCF